LAEEAIDVLYSQLFLQIIIGRWFSDFILISEGSA
jgi:hypothetical protein